MELELPVNKHFFNQIKSHELDEDFRAIKPYWIKKLVKPQYRHLEPIELVELYFHDIGNELFESYDTIIFKNGYNENSPTFHALFGGIRFTLPHEMTCMGQGIAFAIKVEYHK